MSGRKAGAGIGILVNANAKRGGRRVAVQIARALPGASVRLTRTIPEIEGWLRTLPNPRCVLSAGGDGTAIALLNAIKKVIPADAPFPCVGALPLGTGNAWAHALGARKLDPCVRALGRWDGPLPTKKYGLLECDGSLTFFAGSGWDAQVLDDYREQVAATGQLTKSVWTYLSAMLFRTVPKTVVYGRPHVVVENLGDDAYTMTSDGKLLKLEGCGRGAVLYEGMASVAGAATCPEFGYGFRAYPFAERLLGYVNARVYDVGTAQGVMDVPKLWRGAHPLNGMHDWFSKAIRMTFSRPTPLQIAGEAVGIRQTVEYRAADRLVEALDWHQLERLG